MELPTLSRAANLAADTLKANLAANGCNGNLGNQISLWCP